MKKKFFIALLGILFAIFLGYKSIRWYNTFFYAEKFWGIPVPYNSKVLKYENEWEIIGNMGHTLIVFDVSDGEGQMLNILEEKKFKKSYGNELIYRYPLSNVEARTIISDVTMREDLGLNGGYYYDAGFSLSSFKIVIYNAKKKILYFFYKKP